jgi:ElaB/YqjD/DUF883 family membrane-anchored ribosome-binding protein
MSTVFDHDIKTLRGEMAQLRKDFTRLTETITGHHGRHETSRRAQDAVNKVKAEAASAVHNIAAEVDAQPLTAVLAAFGIGLLAGLMVGPRRV